MDIRVYTYTYENNTYVEVQNRMVTYTYENNTYVEVQNRMFSQPYDTCHNDPPGPQCLRYDLVLCACAWAADVLTFILYAFQDGVACPDVATAYTVLVLLDHDLALNEVAASRFRRRHIYLRRGVCMRTVRVCSTLAGIPHCNLCCEISS